MVIPIFISSPLEHFATGDQPKQVAPNEPEIEPVSMTIELAHRRECLCFRSAHESLTPAAAKALEIKEELHVFCDSLCFVIATYRLEIGSAAEDNAGIHASDPYHDDKDDVRDEKS